MYYFNNSSLGEVLVHFAFTLRNLLVVILHSSVN